jgi:hypothetical protein
MEISVCAVSPDAAKIMTSFLGVGRSRAMGPG